MLLTESLLGSSSTAANYIEDVFSTYLYNGNSSTQTITNGIDLSTKGGLVWLKSRNNNFDHQLYDTVRGTGKVLYSNLTNAQSTVGTGLTAFSTNGFTLGSGNANTSTVTYTSWTFRKQAKFFDVVTYTGNGANPRTLTHSLGSVPGCIIFKRTSDIENWRVWHRSLTSGYEIYLNTTSAETANSTGKPWNTTPTSTEFYVGGSFGQNITGETYVAYLFAHDAGGFGASGSDNVISCGSYTGTGAAGNFVSLGYEPQWLLIKRSDASQDWFLFDNMRGLVTGTGGDLYLNPDLSSAEGASGTYVAANATGFTLEGATTGFNASGGTYIYIAIRRGPMKTPTSGTSVFQPNFGSDVTTYTTNFSLDMGWDGYTLGGATDFMAVGARLLGQASLATASTAAESTALIPADFWRSNTSYRFNAYGNDCATYAFRRAPGFFDVVCYTGTGAVNTLNHNLGVVPEIWIIKRRSGGTGDWFVGGGLIGSGTNAYLLLNSTAANVSGLTNLWLTPTSTTFGIGSYNPSDNGINASGSTYVAYLFATVAGVSKVGSYTGTGTTQQINCGFTAGARFVLIKRTNSTGDWYLWDSARGIVAGNDPYLRLNSSSAQVTGTDYVDTYSAGFEISSTAPAAINASGGSFIFLAIA